jgi:acyl carrier protein
MGLELVETVYRIEEEFKITIPNEIAFTLTTPRKVIDYLMSLPTVNEKWSRDYVALSLWLILEDEAAINREDFNEDSRFIEDMGMD